jgi:coproporphyrinogen III oxidase
MLLAALSFGLQKGSYKIKAILTSLPPIYRQTTKNGPRTTNLPANVLFVFR